MRAIVRACLLLGPVIAIATPDAARAATVTAGTYPYAVAVDAVTNKTYVANRDSADVTVIDGITDTPTTVGVGASPYAVAVNAITDKAYVANFDDGTVTVIDGATNTAIATVTVGSAPSAVAINAVTNRIYVVNSSGSVSVLNGATDAVLATVVAGQVPWTAPAINTVTNKAYVPDTNSNDITVIDGSNVPSITTITDLPWAAAVNSVTNRIYVANYFSNSVTVLDGATDTAITTITDGTGPFALAVNSATNTAYVANYDSNTVTVIAGDNSFTTVAVGTGPSSVGVNQATNQIWVANFGSNDVTVIDGGTNQTATSPAGMAPLALAVNATTNRLYVANSGSNDATVIDGSSIAFVSVGMDVVTMLPGGGSLTFPEVSQGGSITVAASPDPPPHPGFRTGGTVYSIAATGVTSPAGFDITLHYTPGAIQPRIYQYVAGVWVDITIPGGVDTVNHTVTGHASAFSDFGVFGSEARSPIAAAPAASLGTLALALGAILAVARLQLGHGRRTAAGR